MALFVLFLTLSSPKMLTCFCIGFKMKYLSNMIPFDFVLKTKFDRDFIFNDAKKKKGEHLMGMCEPKGKIERVYVLCENRGWGFISGMKLRGSYLSF